MKIAILGGGIAGLTAAYDLEQRRKAGADLDWTLYESTNRLGGIVETTRHSGFILEGGPDGWVTEKPWARELAIELGLESQLIASNDATRKTYILIDGALQPMPNRMRMMVPEDLATLEDSTLFSATARAAYASELNRADELRASSPTEDESVSTFIRRHFGDEVLEKIGDPLLSGVFGGNVEILSVRAVMPTFVTMEQEHGSLIAALQSKIKSRSGKPAQPIFTSLRDGVGSLVEALVAKLPSERLQLNRSALSLKREGKNWCVRTSKGHAGKSKKHFTHVIIATSIDAARNLLQPLSTQASALIPQQASSAILATFCWPADIAKTITHPQGFGFLVPQKSSTHPPKLVISTGAQRSGEIAAFTAAEITAQPQLLAATFVDQKFPHRAPENSRIIRAFFGGPSADLLATAPDAEVAAAALTQLEEILGPLPTPDATLTAIRRWPRSLPQYEVGHLDRIAHLDTLIKTLGNLTLLGNGYRGVGLPDLIRDARAAVRSIASEPVAKLS